MQTPARLFSAIAAVCLVATVSAGCQSEGAANRQPTTGSTTVAATAGVQNVVLVVGDNFRFAPSTITVHPGRVQITLQYHGAPGAPHDWQLQGFPADYVPLTTSGQSNSVTFMTPAAGTYKFECTIHVRQGQVGTLVVLPS